ncbi:MAG: TonB C-terminal domain-containing protein [Epsilonproteobacteria bacterium]|nr:TonB C-terminal domain-containing protein [Campylobacterota bacterium]
MKKQILIALLLALLIHILLAIPPVIIYNYYTNHQKFIAKSQEKKIKISLKELPKKHKKSGLIKQKIPNPKIAPPMPKGSQLKQFVKQPVKKPKLNKPKIASKKPPKQPKTEPLPPTKPYIPLLPEKKMVKNQQTEFNTTKKVSKDPMAWLYEDRSQRTQKQKKKTYVTGGNLSQDIKELYGEEFDKLTPGQQQYILNSQEIMRRITQQVLNRVARVNIPRDLRVNRYNVVEFYLHPNGDISDFKFLKKSGYYVLDDTTKETIEYAYSKYPRPKEKTLIRYNVYYHLANY